MVFIDMASERQHKALLDQRIHPALVHPYADQLVHVAIGQGLAGIERAPTALVIASINGLRKKWIIAL